MVTHLFKRMTPMYVPTIADFVKVFKLSQIDDKS